MTFNQKSTAAMLVIIVALYGWYFFGLIPQVLNGSLPEIVYKPTLAALVVLLVVAAIVAHILLAVVSLKELDDEDERDRLIEMRGDQISSYVLAVGTFGGLWLAFVEADHFWIVHALVVGLVLSEVVKNSWMLLAYRRGS